MTEHVYGEDAFDAIKDGIVPMLDKHIRAEIQAAMDGHLEPDPEDNAISFAAEQDGSIAVDCPAYGVSKRHALADVAERYIEQCFDGRADISGAKAVAAALRAAADRIQGALID